MGYYTSYRLTVDDPSRVEEIIDALRQSNEWANYMLDEDGGTEEDGKWYDHKEDMTTFSKGYPDVLFTLYGIGEESPDTWIKYFRNGKCQVCEAIVTFPPFDPDKLV